MAAVTHAGFETQHIAQTGLRARFARLADAFAAHRLRAQQLRELYSFSDRELWDVGLSRADFMAIEKGVYRRD
jgi:uncharacterized protein YjiS (DUF1127 family)